MSENGDYDGRPSALVLREAAARIRTDPAFSRDELPGAIADLLGELAEHAGHGSQGALVLSGVVVASAYMTHPGPIFAGLERRDAGQ